jgi:hypothetical protein
MVVQNTKRIEVSADSITTLLSEKCLHSVLWGRHQEEIGVLPDVMLPFSRQLITWKYRSHGTYVYAERAIDAFLGVNVELNPCETFRAV